MAEQSLEPIYSSFKRMVSQNPDKTALIFLGKRWSYKSLEKDIESFAAGLYSFGVRKGDRVILYLPNIPQWMISFLALHRLGAIPVAIAPIYTPADLEYMTNDSNSKIIICMDTNFGYATQILTKTCLDKIIVTNQVQLLPRWKRLLGLAFNRVPEGKYYLDDNTLSFRKLLKADKTALPEHQATGEDIAVILYTGGTLGDPKGVPYTNNSFMENASIHRLISKSLVPIGEGIILQGGPLYHNLGMTIALVCLCVVGETLILTPRVNLDAYFDIIQRYRVTNFFGVAALFRMILDHDRVDYYDLSSLKYIFTGGDVVPEETITRWQKKFGQRLYEAYGITETCGGVAISSPEEDVPIGSTGKKTPSKSIMFVDPNTLEPVPKGEPGEVLVSSEYMVRSYWNKEEETKECFVNIDGLTWYRTRDVMRQDEDGWLYFLDRSADMIKHKGYRVAASEVERVLQEHNAVTAASVVGIPDPKLGERIKAYVVLRQDVKGVSSYDLMSWCRERLAPYKVPQYIEFRDMLPKSKVGKVLRRELRAEERKKMEKV
jgi:long-chain acyl-CoA synthetase